ncbi:Endonuclease/exonuclease/phosphatase [Pseudocohnilembus persalinus]|uniref:Endonuclease/exonuclease/phosphatase n=1 Tax=Pseudocohnilembus persalinus TaxID=266149 RepID=A0A0V0QD01_PSEPJ|nr:Endonuclease/exonuclease/phosphatase [Pseudocohnilembus persalinus]|eukprot:KRX00012.1 Endonuclease/exonuclease/phosphatase [Pseudocohnilembus persalinus]
MISVATYNIHWCLGVDNVYSIQRIADVIANLSVDIIGLQEMHRQTEQFNDDQLQELQKNLSEFKFSAFLQTMKGYPSNPKSTKGIYGNAILSKFPIIDEKIILFKKGTGYSKSQEQRGAIAVLISKGIYNQYKSGQTCQYRILFKLDNDKFWFITTHFGCDITGFEQQSQSLELLKFIKNELQPSSENIILTELPNYKKQQNKAGF